MAPITIVVLIALLALAFLPVWPMQYQLFSYENAVGTTYGFRGRKWLFGQWAAFGRGKNSLKRGPCMDGPPIEDNISVWGRPACEVCTIKAPDSSYLVP